MAVNRLVVALVVTGVVSTTASACAGEPARLQVRERAVAPPSAIAAPVTTPSVPASPMVPTAVAPRATPAAPTRTRATRPRTTPTATRTPTKATATKATPTKATPTKAAPEAKAAAEASTHARTPTPRPRTSPPGKVVVQTVALKGPTSWPALNAAIGRIPGYSSRGIRWTVSSRYGHWGATDMATGQIFISPSVRLGVLDSVVRHEYAHIVTVRAYDGDWRTAKRATNAVFGGTGRTGVERAADCMARRLGASFTQYTSCSRADWRRAAARLLSGRRL